MCVQPSVSARLFCKVFIIPKIKKIIIKKKQDFHLENIQFQGSLLAGEADMRAKLELVFTGRFSMRSMCASSFPSSVWIQSLAGPDQECRAVVKFTHACLLRDCAWEIWLGNIFLLHPSRSFTGIVAEPNFSENSEMLQ